MHFLRTYLGTKFRVRHIDEILTDITMAHKYIPPAPLERTIIGDKDKHISPYPDQELSNGLGSYQNLLLPCNQLKQLPPEAGRRYSREQSLPLGMGSVVLAQ